MPHPRRLTAKAVQGIRDVVAERRRLHERVKQLKVELDSARAQLDVLPTVPVLAKHHGVSSSALYQMLAGQSYKAERATADDVLAELERANVDADVLDLAAQAGKS